MIVTTRVVFKGRRDPFEYDMTDRGGSKGTSYSFDVLDEDDAKQKVKCPRETWEDLANVPKGTVLELQLVCANVKLASVDGIRIAQLTDA